MNSLSQTAFDAYKLKNLHHYDKGDYVSRGGIKLNQILELSGLVLRGSVVDLGCGRGAWSQLACASKEFTSVKGYTRGGAHHEEPVMWDTLGYNIAELRSGEDVYMMEPFGSDVSFCDIGEENPDFDVQTRRMMLVLNMLERWRPYSTM